MPTNDHLIADPGFRADTSGPYTMVDLSELPASLQGARKLRNETRGAQLGATQMFPLEPQQMFPLDTSEPAVDPALIAGLVEALQSGQQYASSVPPPVPPTVAPTPTPVAPSMPAVPMAPLMMLAPVSYETETAVPTAAAPSEEGEQVVARLPVEIDLTHSDGRVYLEVLVPYREARLLSIAASRCLVVTVGVEDELLYLATDGVGATTLTAVNAPAFDEVLLTEGDRIGILVRFPPALGLITGAYVDVTLYVGAAPHVTVK